jgi:hypothetical protein
VPTADEAAHHAAAHPSEADHPHFHADGLPFKSTASAWLVKPTLMMR